MLHLSDYLRASLKEAEYVLHPRPVTEGIWALDGREARLAERNKNELNHRGRASAEFIFHLSPACAIK